MPRIKENIRKEKVGITLDPYTIKKIDYFIKKQGVATNRTSFIEKAIFYYLLYLEKEENRKR